MSTAPTVKQEQSARSQNALIEAATALFAERGYRETSVQAIAARAGVSRGSIFWHFESKEGLLWAVAARAFEAWETEVLVPDVGKATGIEAVSRALAAHRRFLTERGEDLRLFYVLMFEALGPRPELAPEFAKLHANLRSMTVGLDPAGDRSGGDPRRRRRARGRHDDHRRTRWHRVPVAAGPRWVRSRSRVRGPREDTPARGLACATTQSRRCITSRPT